MKKFCTLFAVTLLLLWASLAFGQRDGIPSFVAAERFQYDSVNLLTLQTSLDIPVLTKSAGPLPGSISLTSPQYCYTGRDAMNNPITLCNGNQFDFIPEEMVGMKAQYTTQANPGCTINGVADTEYFVQGLTGSDGLSFYRMDNFNTVLHSVSGCGSLSATSTTTDSTGLTATINFQPQYQAGGYIQALNNASGWTPGSDAFGNTISFGVNGSNQTYFQDTLGAQTIVPTTCCGPGTYTYKDTSGTSQNVTVTAGTATNFHNATCGTSGVTTYTPISSISYPDGTSFSFTWDSLQSGTIDGLIKSFTMPTGGTITYTYGTMTCAPWSYSTLSRQTPDGTTTYSVSVNGSITTTTVLDPGKNKIVYTFFGTSTSAEVFTKDITRYQNTGTVASPAYTEISYTKYCYNTLSCTTAPTFPITQRDTYEYLGTGPTQMSHRVELYDSTYGLLTSNANTDSITSQTITKTIAYGTWNGSSCAAITNTKIVDHPCTITVKNGTTQLSYETFTYNANGALTASTEWVSSTDTLTTNYTRNSTGTPATITLPNSQVITNTFGSCNSLMLTDSTTTVNSVAIDNKATWNCDAGVITDTTDPNSNEDDTTYDSMNRIASHTDRLENVTSYAYGTPTLDHVKITDPLSVVAYIYNDGSGRATNSQVCQTTGCSNLDTFSKAYAWNGTNFETTTYVPCTKTTLNSACTTVALTSDVNPIAGLIKTTDANSGTLTGAVNSKDFSVTAGPAPSQENTKVLQTEIDGFGRTTSTCALEASGGTTCGQTMGNSGILTSNTYSFPSAGVSEVQAVRGSQTHTTKTDSLGRVTSIATPEAGTFTDVYDSIASGYCFTGSSASSSPGALVATDDAAGNKACIYRDGLYRLTDVGNNNQSSTNYCKRFRYDSTANKFVTAPTGYPATPYITGRLFEVETDNCAGTPTTLTDEWFAYDKDGRMTDMFQWSTNSGGYYHTTAGYDADGTVTSIGGIPSASTFDYGVDGEDRWNSMTVNSTTLVSSTAGNGFTYDAASRPTNVPMGSSGDQDTFTFDNVGNMMDYKFSVNSKTFEGALTWNSIGSLNKQVITDGFNSGGTQTCTYGTSTVEGYDDVGRLLDANCGSLIQHDSWTYDQYDNATRTGNPGTTWNPGYSSTTNEMTGSNYDSAGNLTYDGVNSYSWNVYGQMAGTISGNHSVSCGSGGSICAYYDAFGRVVESSNGTTYIQTLYSPAGKVAYMSGQNVHNFYLPAPGGGVIAGSSDLYFLHPDWLGTKRLSTDLSTRAYSYDTAFTPYGESYDTFGTLVPDFTGLTQDVAAGLFTTPTRTLATNSSRWPSPDPAHSGWNAYAYVADPNTQTDRSGLGLNPCPEGDACDKKHNDPCTGSGLLEPCGGQITIQVTDDPTKSRNFYNPKLPSLAMAGSIFKFFPEMTPEQSIVYNKARLGEAVKMLQDLTQKFEAQRKLIDYLTEQTANLRRSASKLSNNRQFDEIMAERYKAVADGLTLKDTMTELNAEIQRVTIDIQQIGNLPDFDILGSASVDYIGAGLSAFGLWETFVGSTANSSQDATYWSPGIHSSQWYRNSQAPGIDGPWPTLPRACTPADCQ